MQTIPSASLASSSIKAGNDATITFRFPQEKKDALERLTNEQGVKLSKLINEILDKASK
jgi:predicted DNA-binding protein